MDKKTDNITSARRAGVLLHVSSLPGKYGIGTMGAEARRFADFAKAAGFSYWQILPLVQTGYGNSPYQSVYGGSGNPWLIDPDIFFERGLLKRSELSSARRKNGGRTDYEFLRATRIPLLRKAFSRFDCADADFVRFEQEGAFSDYALYMALKEKFAGASFDCWDKKYKYRDLAALAAFSAENAQEIRFWLFVQYEFLRQWHALKEYVNGIGLRIVGDIPLYVAYDSADVWANPQLFKLDKKLRRTKVAGVPPDYFSATGQLWGNPVYDWRAHEREGYAWWIDRIRRAFDLYDVVRLDHFRGLDRYFEVDAAAETAVDGRWRKAPGMKLFDAAKAQLGGLDFIAEDLGVLDEGVYRLIHRTGYPGMRIIEFAFDGSPQNPYLPANITENSVCYTGTHDNDTLVGFYDHMPEWERTRLKEQLRPLLAAAHIRARLSGAKSVAAAMADLALSVRSRLCVLPVQDILLLGGEARMNVPAVPSGNWEFRLREVPDAACAQKWRDKLARFERL